MSKSRMTGSSSEGQIDPADSVNESCSNAGDASLKVSLVIVNKDERLLADTLCALKPFVGNLLHEVLVVDASNGALDDIRLSNEWAGWIDYTQPPGVRTTIAHQRNIGVIHAQGDVIVFTDSGCLPQEDWLKRITTPILEEEEFVTCGPSKAVGKSVYPGNRGPHGNGPVYVPMATTINIAFRREAFDAVNGFDETFGAAEDLDFTWRLTDVGFRLRWVENAVVTHDWGTPQRQIRRAFFYGKGGCRLLRKHPHRIVELTKENPVPIAYALFLLSLPLALKYRRYPLLILWPIWRLRDNDIPWLALLDHVSMGAGFLYELVRPGT